MTQGDVFRGGGSKTVVICQGFVRRKRPHSRFVYRGSPWLRVAHPKGVEPL